MNDDEIRELARRVAELEWFHSIDLGSGVVTPGTDRSEEKLARLGLPEDLRGRSVLDIGAYDGFFSFAAERRGADRVLAVDTLAWERGPGSGWPCFSLAHSTLSSRVATQKLDIHTLAEAGIGTFDIVMCLGVVYHLKDPRRALKAVAEVTEDLLILETHTDVTHLRRPGVVFYEGDELAGDASNWCGPNERMLAMWLRDVGFREVEVVHRRSVGRRALRALYRAGIRLDQLPTLFDQGRVVVHARK